MLLNFLHAQAKYRNTKLFTSASNELIFLEMKENLKYLPFHKHKLIFFAKFNFSLSLSLPVLPFFL